MKSPLAKYDLPCLYGRGISDGTIRSRSWVIFDVLFSFVLLLWLRFWFSQCSVCLVLFLGETFQKEKWNCYSKSLQRCWGLTIWNQSSTPPPKKTDELGLLCVVVFVCFYSISVSKNTRKKNLFCDLRFIEIFGWKLGQKFEIQSIDLAHSDDEYVVLRWNRTLYGSQKMCFFKIRLMKSKENEKFHFYFREFWRNWLIFFFDSLLLLALCSHTFDNWWKFFFLFVNMSTVSHELGCSWQSQSRNDSNGTTWCTSKCARQR